MRSDHRNFVKAGGLAAARDAVPEYRVPYEDIAPVAIPQKAEDVAPAAIPQRAVDAPQKVADAPERAADAPQKADQTPALEVAAEASGSASDIVPTPSLSAAPSKEPS